MATQNRFHIERLGSVLDSAFPADDLASLLPLPAPWKCDLATDALEWGPGVFDIFGIPHGTPIDRREIVERYTEESRAELEALRAAAIANLGSFTFEACIRRFDGATRWMRVSADVVVDKGRATHLYGTKQDITTEMLLAGKLF